MALQRELIPYEYLHRHGKGQHVRYLERLYDDVSGETVFERETDAIPVHEAGDYPLADVLGRVAAEQAVEASQERAARVGADAQREAAVAEASAERTRRTEAEAEAATLRAELAKVRDVADPIERVPVETEPVVRER